MKQNVFRRTFFVVPLSGFAILAMATSSGKPTIHYKTYKNSHGKIWTTEAQIPQVSGVVKASELNKAVEKYERDRCRAWVKDSGRLANTWTHTPNALQREVRSANVYPRLFTYVTGVFFDTGGAHPGYMFDGSKYALKNGQWKSIKTAQFFTKGYKWADELNQLMVPILKDKGAMFLWNGMVKSVPVEDMENVGVTDKGLRFYINPYDVGPWAQGQFIVTIPYSSIKGLDPQGPLAEYFPRF